MSLSKSLQEEFKVGYDIEHTNRLLNQIIEDSNKKELISRTGRLSDNSHLSCK
jgi:hypothetical protein